MSQALLATSPLVHPEKVSRWEEDEFVDEDEFEEEFEDEFEEVFEEGFEKVRLVFSLL